MVKFVQYDNSCNAATSLDIHGPWLATNVLLYTDEVGLVAVSGALCSLP